jgi:hydroxymethylpyrimidine/phosphomethylpyrimidine kinase
VLDPVMIAKGGGALLEPDAVEALLSAVLPLATVTTPNMSEAAAMTRRSVVTLDDMHAAARTLIERGARAVVVKGGHLEGDAVDVFTDGSIVREFRAARIDSRHTHGTGCTFASAIAAELALGRGLLEAIEAAKRYITRAIANAPGLGHGHGPLGTG